MNPPLLLLWPLTDLFPLPFTPTTTGATTSKFTFNFFPKKFAEFLLNSRSGIFDDPTCPTNEVNHAVTIVGYGKDSASGKNYWIVRNQWGAGWGAGGYILMRRGVNMCNINSYGAYPTVA